jgi:hypothetical protein
MGLNSFYGSSSFVSSPVQQASSCFLTGMVLVQFEDHMYARIIPPAFNCSLSKQSCFHRISAQCVEAVLQCILFISILHQWCINLFLRELFVQF